MDVVIPIVFPDYRITVEIPRTEVDILPYFDFDNFTIPKTKEKLSNLGHAGVLFVDGVSGTTKYYEYGRYDPPKNLGLVRRIQIKDASVIEGAIELQSLKKPLRQIATISGNASRIEAAYIEVNGKFQKMLTYAESRKSDNMNPRREPYDVLTNSCIHFVKSVVETAGADSPWLVDPRPNSYIGEFQNDFPYLRYDYRTDKLDVEGVGRM